jgi:hypothetical protein
MRLCIRMVKLNMLKKVFKDRRTILTASILALLSLVVLASAINNMTFRQARRLSREESEVIRIPVGKMLESAANIPLEKLAAFIVLLLLFGVLIVIMLPAAMRKKLLRQLARMTLGILLFLFLLKLKPDLLEGLFSIFNFGTGQGAPPSAAAGVPPPVFDPPQISGWFSFFITLGILLLTGLLFWRIHRWWMRRRETLDVPSALDEIAEVARASLRDLSFGQNSAKDKIIQCYADMSRVVIARRGLYREHAMTASEFARRLEKAGLPREPVNRLTYLFESVRYGARTSAQGEVDEAIACLKSILKYCGEALS